MRILLVEDDKNLSHSLKFQLEKNDYLVDCCYDGEEALYYIRERIHDIVLLDCMLPLVNGTEVLSTIRREHIKTPVLMITALGTLDDKVKGVNLGADDYLVKPFDFEELLARIRCIARRPSQLIDEDFLACGDLRLYQAQSRLTGPIGSISLSKKENLLLEVLIYNSQQTLSRNVLLTKVWGPESEIEEGNLDNYIHFLRRRLKTVGSFVSIHTIRGIGYRIEVPVSTEG